MENKETIHSGERYRCRLCGQLSPMFATRCGNPGCGALLSLYGEITSGEAAFVTPPAAPPKEAQIPQTEAPNPPPAQPAAQPREEYTPSPARSGAGKRLRSNPWRLATVVTAAVSLVTVLILAYLLSDANARVDSAARSYNWLDSKYSDLQQERDALQQERDALQAFLSNNGLDLLYQVTVKEVYNSDSDGKKIDNKLTADTMERLCISITITAADIANRWEDPLEVTLLSADSTVANWTIDPNKKYGDGTESVEWRMWVRVDSPGTYTAEFRHKGFVILRREITVK